MSKSVNEVINGHRFQSFGQRLLTWGKQKMNFTVPRFSIARQIEPKFVIVLENSQTMNMKDHWDFIRTTSKKFIQEDLPDSTMLGLVLFIDAAHIAQPVTTLGPKSS